MSIIYKRMKKKNITNNIMFTTINLHCGRYGLEYQALTSNFGDPEMLKHKESSKNQRTEPTK